MSILWFHHLKRKTDKAFEEGYKFGYEVGILEGENNEQAD